VASWCHEGNSNPPVAWKKPKSDSPAAPAPWVTGSPGVGANSIDGSIQTHNLR
jgi:hypothetical protein